MHKLLDKLLLPLLRRLGSILAGAAATIGATQDEIGTIEAALLVLAGLAVDLYNSHRDNAKKETLIRANVDVHNDRQTPTGGY